MTAAHGGSPDGALRIGLVVSDIALTRPVDTSLMLAREASARGHDVIIWGIGDVAIGSGGRVTARGRRVPRPAPAGNGELCAVLRDLAQPRVLVDVATCDLLLMRADPNDGPGARTWSSHAIIRLGHLAVEQGVDVVNDPDGLLRALDKSYLARLPCGLVPRFVVSRDEVLLRGFIEELEGPAVIKPVSGAGGRRVFLIAGPRDANLNQMLELAADEGYVMVQEYVPAAADGTLRVFVVGGAPLVVDGRHAALRHCPGPDDHRSNIHAGGAVAPARLGAEDIATAEAVAPLLARDGLVVAGLDLAGGKVLEVNVFSPGGMWGVERFEGAGFALAVVRHLEARRYARRG